MEQKIIETTLKKIIKLLKAVFPENKFVIGGSYGLYLNGIILPRDFHDIDVRILGMDPREVRKQKDKVEAFKSVDFLGNTNVPLETNEIEFDGENILVYTPKTILDCKRQSIWFNEHRVFKTEFTGKKNEKDRKDIEYIKEKYGIE